MVVTLQGVRVGLGASAHQLVDKGSVSQQGWSGRTGIDGMVLKDGDINQTDCLSEPDHCQGLDGGLCFLSTPLSLPGFRKCGLYMMDKNNSTKTFTNKQQSVGHLLDLN